MRCQGFKTYNSVLGMNRLRSSISFRLRIQTATFIFVNLIGLYQPMPKF